MLHYLNLLYLMSFSSLNSTQQPLYLLNSIYMLQTPYIMSILEFCLNYVNMISLHNILWILIIMNLMEFYYLIQIHFYHGSICPILSSTSSNDHSFSQKISSSEYYLTYHTFMIFSYIPLLLMLNVHLNFIK